MAQRTLSHRGVVIRIQYRVLDGALAFLVCPLERKVLDGRVNKLDERYDGDDSGASWVIS